jgi:stage IV sporulation protein FB
VISPRVNLFTRITFILAISIYSFIFALMSDFETYYPPKPKLVKKEAKNHISVTIFSMVLFALTFSLIIEDYLLIGLLLIVLLVHEFGHFIFMKWFGYKNLKMLFIPFIGAMVQGEKKRYSQIQSLIMVMAGPLPGIFFGSFLLVYGQDSLIAVQLGVLFLIINVLNLIPVDPLDGGKVFQLMFFQNHEFIQLVFAFLSSLAIICIGWYFDAWLIVAFGFLMGFRVKSIYKNYQIRSEMKLNFIRYESDYDSLSDSTYHKIKKIILDYNPILEKIKEESEEERYDQIVAHQVEGVLSQPMKKDASFITKLVATFFWLGAIALCFYVFFSVDTNIIFNAFQGR